MATELRMRSSSVASGVDVGAVSILGREERLAFVRSSAMMDYVRVRADQNMAARGQDVGFDLTDSS